MTNLEKWNARYEKCWCTKAQLKRLVGLEVLTPADYKTITGEEYTA